MTSPDTLHWRSMALRPNTWDTETRSVEAVLATETPATSTDTRTNQGIFEVWRMDGAEYADQCPLIDNHQRGSVYQVLGSVRDIRRVGDSLLGRLYVSEAEPAIAAKVREGHIRDVSAGIQPLGRQTIPAGETRKVMGVHHTAPVDRSLNIVTQWRLREVSLTPIGADPNSKIRNESEDDANMVSTSQEHRGPKAMTTAIEELEALQKQQSLARKEQQQEASGKHAVTEIHRKQGERLAAEFDWDAHAGKRLFETCRSLLQRLGSAAGIDNPHAHDDYTVCRATISSPALQSTFSTKIGSMVVAGYGEVPDTTKGIVTALPSPTFLANDLVTIEETTRLRRQRKGRAAEHVAFSAASTPRSVTRYAAQLAFDEQDAVDSATTTGAFFMAFTELGRAARRCYLDLVWSKFLQNPVCYDGTALVHANHANSITTALGSTGLNNANTKLLGQSFAADNGAVNQLGLIGRYLVVPAAVYEKAREVARLYQLDGDANNLVVVPENRLGANGTTDPETSTVVTGSDTCWALFAPAAQRPAVVVSYLEGSSTSPKIDSYTLDQGQWGMGWSVRLDIGVAFVDWRSIVFSTGAG